MRKRCTEERAEDRTQRDAAAVERGEVALDPLQLRMEVHLMTLQAEERFVLLQKVVGNGAMRVVADIAIFFDWRMLKHKGSLMASVAVETKVASLFLCL